MGTQIVINDFSDTEYLTELMDKYKDSSEPFFGKNSNNEDIMISICEDSIVVETWQSNGWSRKNYYYRDGTSEELFDGKWSN